MRNKSDSYVAVRQSGVIYHNTRAGELDMSVIFETVGTLFINEKAINHPPSASVSSRIPSGSTYRFDGAVKEVFLTVLPTNIEEWTETK